MSLFSNLPKEFKNRVCRTKHSPYVYSLDKRLGQILEEFSGSEIDILYENTHPILVLVFQSEIDLLAYKVKYGEDYV
jgi:hypothetical protein